MKNPIGDIFFRPKRNEIVYNFLKTEKGWQLQAFLPSRISTNDRIKIIDWFHSYRSMVLELHPFWITAFTATQQVYLLDITPTETPKELIATAVDNGQMWAQLDFDYAA